MTTPVKNNQLPPPPANDPYAKNYGTGGGTDPYGDYGTGSGGYDPGYDPSMGGGGDSYGDYGSGGQGYGDEFVGGPQGEGGPAPQSELSVQGLRDMAGQLKSQLGDQYAHIMGEINHAASLPPDQQQPELQRIAEEMNNIAYPPEAPAGTEGADGEKEDDGSAALKTQMEDFKKAINENTDLSSDQKKEYTEKLDKWIQGMELGTITVESAQDNLDSLKQEVSDATAFPPTFQKLEEITGKDPKQLEDLFAKYGLDPKNLPSPPDEKVAALLNDPSFSENIQSAKKDITDGFGKIKEAADKLKTDCANENANREAHTSGVTYDDQPFKSLADLAQGKGEDARPLIEARKKLATELTSVLTAMYGAPPDGPEIKVVSDDTQAGSITFNGTPLNVCKDSTSGVVGFSPDTKVDWPHIDMPKYATDNEGDGVKTAPQWVKDAGFPVYSYDGNTVDGST